ncbi:MAG: NADH-quinone oxidoreductase subunit NuoG, partial [Candidatus Binatia bacterium]
RAPKPQPACATPVMDGMKVFTRSAKAVAAQQATMEFLLINHPLDCPICDQGGECELQDLALGYGSAVSQFTERKRVVRDKNIGPLVQTDMTRCIHCTRCVRFGEEVAGLRELGATGRGEAMEIGTYVEQAMISELSGNVIDLCPVGALTSKPYRYSARAWELRQFEAIAPHDCVGSNVHVHTKGAVVKRVIPRENEAVNETWISDRDRFGYQGLRHEERLLVPRIKENDLWRECDWDTALDRFQTAITAAGRDNRLGALASPSSTCEELFLLQRLVRELGSRHIDHRLRQLDYSLDAHEPRFPSLGFQFNELEQADRIVIIGGYPRHDQPLINHRIRKAQQRGGRVIVIDCLEQSYNFDLAARLTVAPSRLVPALGGVTRAALELLALPSNPERTHYAQYEIAPAHRAVTEALCVGHSAGDKTFVIVGQRAQGHPARGRLLSLASHLAAALQGRAGQLTEGANAAGAWLAGAVPHRGPGGRALDTPGLAAMEMLTSLDAFILLGVEPDLDCAAAAEAVAALKQARFVASLTAFSSPALEAQADLMLPIASFGENEGSFINACGAWQTFAPAVKSPGVARPAWKILRALGGRCALPGFDAVVCSDVTRELQALCGVPVAEALAPLPLPEASLEAPPPGLEIITQVPLNRVDGLIRRANALQQMPQSGDCAVHVSPATLASLKLVDHAEILAGSRDVEIPAVVISDVSVPEGCCLVYAATELAARLPHHATLKLRAEATTR